MSGWTALVPIKPAADRKTRLDPHLSPAARVHLTETMLAHVVATLARLPAIADIALLARERPDGWSGGWFADGGGGLNAELAAVARRTGGRLAILHADLPAVAPEDIAALVAAADAAGSAIAPDRHLRGTNALAFEAARAVPFAFGAHSFRRHRAAFPAARIVRRPGLALDIDDADDLAEAIRLGVLSAAEASAR